MDFHELYAYTGQLNLLYVEDEPDIRDATRMLLENYFKRVDVAENGKEGLQLYQRSIQSGQRYDIVISDINMPFLNGLEMARAIKEAWSDQVVIFISAHNEQEYLLDAIKLGIDYYLIKPIDLDELTKLLWRTAKAIDNSHKVKQQEEKERERASRTKLFQQALLKWANVDYENTDESIQEMTALSAKTLGVDRVSVWLYDDTQSHISCVDLYSIREEQHSKGVLLSKEEYPAYFDALKENRIMPINEARKDPRTIELLDDYLVPNDIYSILDIPIMQNGELLGVISHESVGEIHPWSFEEEEFAMTLANNLALSIEIKKRHEVQEHLRFQKEMLDYQAHHAHLTGLPNRTLFIDRLQQAIKLNQRNNTQIAVLFIDLDRFKQINDLLGHTAGDHALTILAKRLHEQVRECDTLARLGGDEFTLIIDNLTDTKIVVDIIQKIMQCTTEPIVIDNHQLYVTLSIGVTIYPYDGISVDALLKNADSAMYKAKDEGRNTYQYYTQEMTEKAVKRVKLETALRQAISNKKLEVYYQPQYDATSGALVGMEALTRWKDENGEMIPPDLFIPIAEDTGMIVEIDRWVMQTSIKQFKRWFDEGLNPGELSLNLSMKQLREGDCIDFLAEVLDENNFHQRPLAFEITEGRIMKNPEMAIEILRKLKSMGIGLAIDDFGTGYSSLSYLKKLPLDTLKIDRAFVEGLPDHEEDEAISKAIIALAKSLKLKVVAEGVETEEQKNFLTAHGCHIIQGFYYSEPLLADEIHTLLTRASKT